MTLRILEKTDQLYEPGDPLDLAEAGKDWYWRWVGELRAKYWDLFDVPQQIVSQEAVYGAMTFGADGKLLEGSDLYIAFRENAPSESGSAPAFDAGAWLVTLG